MTWNVTRWAARPEMEIMYHVWVQTDADENEKYQAMVSRLSTSMMTNLQLGEMRDTFEEAKQECEDHYNDVLAKRAKKAAAAK